MTIVRTVFNIVFVLSAGAWLGASVLLAVVTPRIESSLKGRRTEARQLLRRLLGAFQRIELGLMIAAWAGRGAAAAIVWIWPGKFPNVPAAAEVVALALLILPTLAAVYATAYLTGAIKRREGQLGSYADKNEQIRVRKRIGGLLKQAEVFTWLKALCLAAALVAGVIAMGHARAGATTQPTTREAPAATQPATEART